MGREAKLPHKFLGLSTWRVRKETCQVMNIKSQSCKRERERERLYYCCREERNPGSKQGREQEGSEGEPWKRGTVQGELLKALGAKHNRSIEINGIPPVPSRAQRCSPRPD